MLIARADHVAVAVPDHVNGHDHVNDHHVNDHAHDQVNVDGGVIGVAENDESHARAWLSKSVSEAQRP